MTSPIFAGDINDPFESKQDVQELNLQTLIGCTDERGDAWHRRDDLMGDESNHYPGFIPLDDVYRRLLNWRPRRADVAYLIPVRDNTFARAADTVVIDGQQFRVVKTSQDRIGVLRDDNDFDLGVFTSRANHPPYQTTLIEEAERLTGITLGVSTAGVLQQGGVAWMEFSLPQSCHDPKSGLSYRPNLIHADSMNGTIAYTKALTIEATVCMNTLTRNLVEASGAGSIVRHKHTRNIVTRGLQGERDVLGVLEQVDEQFLAELHAMIEAPISKVQRIEVMDIMVPLAEDASDRSRTLANNKRDRLWALDSNAMVEPWLGTVFGEFQRYNTDDHWNAPAKNTGQWERNAWRTITGKRAEADRAVVAAIEKVLVSSA